MACHLGYRPNVGLLSLQDICLSVIASNFERYLATLKQQNSSVPRHHLKFLERHYCERIFSSKEFKSIRFYQKLTHEHLDFFLNPYMKELDLVYILRNAQDYLMTGIIKKLKTFGKNIVSFKVSLCGSNESLYLRVLSLMPNLEKIEFQNMFSFETSHRNESFYTFMMSSVPYEAQKEIRCFPTPKIIKEIGKGCPLLKELKFPIHLHFLWGFQDLYKEDIQAVSTIMRHCTQLEVLDFPDTIGVLYEMHKNDLKTMKDDFFKCKKYALRTLSARGGDYPLSLALKLCAALCPRASDLHIHSLASDSELEQCFRFEHLEDVTFKWITGITPNHLNQFLIQKGKKLINLELHYTLHLSILTLIQSCPKLQSLTLCNSLWGAPDVTDIFELPCKFRLPNLRRLVFVRTDFAVEIISNSLKLILSAAKGVETLIVTECYGLSSELFDSLDLSHIRELKIQDSEVSGDSLMKLLLQGNIQKLELFDCLSYEERLKLRSFKVVKIICRHCERMRICRSKLYSGCFEACKWCNELGSPFW